MMRFLTLTATILAIAAINIHASDSDSGEKVVRQQDELRQIQADVQSAKHRLDSLKKSEISTQGKISEYDQRIASNKKIISRLNSELKQLRKQIADTESELLENQEILERTRRRFLGNLREFYYASRRAGPLWMDYPNQERDIDRQLVYLTALSSYESENVATAAEQLARTVERFNLLGNESNEVASLRRSKETTNLLQATKKQRQEISLRNLRRKETEEADRMITLQQAAREVGRIIARLESERARRFATLEEEPDLPSILQTMRGHLLPPCRGQIVQTFGPHTDPVTKLKSFSPGITIKGRPARVVVAVAAGTIAYVGSLRGYGNFIIINHDNRYYSTYANLGKMNVSEGEYVLSETVLARADDKGKVRFELRDGNTPLDPVKWIRLDAF
ncbi:MAG: murein hydrolase activator EnvC family protein [Candidatus Zixiibacteriota bacterium]